MPSAGTPKKTDEISTGRNSSNSTGGRRPARKTTRRSGRAGAKLFTSGSRRFSFLPLLAVWMLAIVILSGLIYWGENSAKHSSQSAAHIATSSSSPEKRLSSVEERQQDTNRTKPMPSKPPSSETDAYPVGDEAAQPTRPPKPKTSEKEEVSSPSTHAPGSKHARSQHPEKPVPLKEERNSPTAGSDASTSPPPADWTPLERLSSARNDPTVQDPKPKSVGSDPASRGASSGLDNDGTLPPFKDILPSHRSTPSASVTKLESEASRPPKENLSLALQRPEPGTEPTVSPPAPIAPTVARVAIVIDDFGQDLEMAKKFLEIPLAITFSVLPYQSHSREIAQLAHDRHHEVLLHLPMEPHGYPKTNPGNGALLLSMSQEKIQETLESALDSSPFASGVNNHMGSRFTEDSRSMKILLKELRQRDLYFLDSYTSPKSVGVAAAREFRMPTGRRDIFLDHEVTEEFTRAQIQRLIRRAKIEGAAIAIGHPHDTTLRILRENAGQFQQAGIAVVPAGQLMANPTAKTRN